MKGMETNLDIKDVIVIAKQVGEVLLDYYNRNYSVSEKKNKTPVTDADLAAEKVILKGLQEISDYPILSEEKLDDLSRLQKEYLWIVDPLDGTKEFIKKTENFCTLISLLYKNQPILGIIYKPLTKELYFAEQGSGAYLQKANQSPQKINVSNKNQIDQMKLIVTGSNLEPLDLKIIKGLGIDFTQVGSVGVKMGLLAEGKADLYISTSKRLSEWDICAPEIILKEAGGILTDLFGNQIKYNQSNILGLNGVIASNNKKHHDIIIHKIAPFISK